MSDIGLIGLAVMGQVWVLSNQQSFQGADGVP